MSTLRKAAARGATRIGWLDSRHTFSFGDYADPKFHNFRTLRVINDDRVAPGAGFDTHPHRDMEIFTYVLSGELEHKDSMGTGAVIRAGDWQAMSAGTGVLHSEFNPSRDVPVHLLQMWIMPNVRGAKPTYQQQSFASTPPNRWRVGLSPDGRDGSMTIRQDALVSHARLEPDAELTYAVPRGRGVWLHAATGKLIVDGVPMEAGDGLAVEDGSTLRLVGIETAELVLFDLA